MNHRIVHTSRLGGLLVAAALLGGTTALQAQGIPGDDTPRPWGQGVAPVYEGWYEAPDGDGIYLSFGYLNRNSDEVVDIPLGPNNSLSSADHDGLQPTHFEPWREYGYFTLHVPEDFGRDEIVWTLSRNGQTWSIPARATTTWYQIDAMYAPGTGLTPPAIRFERNGDEGRGPHGIRTHAGTATVGQPFDLTLHTEDDTWGLGEGTEGHDVQLYYRHYQGPGAVEFGRDRINVEAINDLAEVTNTVTFSEPGEYVVLVRAFNEPVPSAGMEQCCWTNGYIGVTVTP